jgi:hypothetical protein
MSEFEGLGHKPSEHTLRNLASRLKDEGYLEIRFAGGSRFRSAAFIQLTEYGRKEAHDVDPFERTQLETRGLLASEEVPDGRVRGDVRGLSRTAAGPSRRRPLASTTPAHCAVTPAVPRAAGSRTSPKGLMPHGLADAVCPSAAVVELMPHRPADAAGPLIVGEVRGPETLDLLVGLSTAHAARCARSTPGARRRRCGGWRRSR